MKIISAILLSLSLTAAAHAQVAVGTITGKTCYASFTGYVAYVQISSGSFTPQVTTNAGLCGINQGVQTQQPITFADNTGSLVTITANCGKANPLPGQCVLADGLIVSNGRAVNPLQTNGPTLYFTSNTNAAIAALAKVPAGVVNAVSGTTKQDDDCLGNPQLPGGLLVDNGKPGPCVIPKSFVIAPRSAAGITSDGTTLILVAVGGNENSTGLMTYDFANLLIGLGAQNAVNFDGGGSTSFNWLWPTGPNTPSISPSLQAMISNAGFPHGQPNPAQLSFTAMPVADPTQNITFCDQTNNCRYVYANLGFSYTPTASLRNSQRR